MAVINLIPFMTSYTAPSGVITDTHYSSGYGWKAVDGSIDSTAYDGQYWYVDYPLPSYLQYAFSGATIITSYSVKATINGEAKTPKTWTLKASNTGAFSGEEVTLDTQTDITSWTSAERKTFTLSNSTAYTYYRLTVTAGNDTYDLFVDEFQLLGDAPSPQGVATVTVTATALPISYPTATANMSVISEARAYPTIADENMFTFAYTIQNAMEESGFKFIYSIEQPKTATIIKRVNT